MQPTSKHAIPTLMAGLNPRCCRAEELGKAE